MSVSHDVSGDGRREQSLPEMRFAVSYVSMSCTNVRGKLVTRKETKGSGEQRAHLQQVDALPV